MKVGEHLMYLAQLKGLSKRDAKAAIEQLRRADVDVAGVVLQQVDLERYGRVGYGDSGYYYHYGRYGKYYSGWQEPGMIDVKQVYAS